MVGKVTLETFLVGRQAEEPVELGQPLERDLGVVRADGPAGGLDDVAGGTEPSSGSTSLRTSRDSVAVGIRPADHLLGSADVIGVGRPDEPVGVIAKAASASLNRANFSSTNSRVGRPSSTAAWAMLTRRRRSRSGSGCRHRPSGASARWHRPRSPRTACAGPACCWHTRSR